MVCGLGKLTIPNVWCKIRKHCWRPRQRVIIIIIIIIIIVIKLGEKDKEVKSAGQCGTRGHRGGDNGPQVHATQQSQPRDQDHPSAIWQIETRAWSSFHVHIMTMITIVLIHHHGFQRLFTHLPPGGKNRSGWYMLEKLHIFTITTNIILGWTQYDQSNIIVVTFPF